MTSPPPPPLPERGGSPVVIRPDSSRQPRSAENTSLFSPVSGDVRVLTTDGELLAPSWYAPICCLVGDELSATIDRTLQTQPADVRERILWRDAAELFGRTDPLETR